MQVIYTVELAARQSIKDEVEKTVEALEKFGVTAYEVADEIKNDDVYSAFIEVIVDGEWKKHVEFAKRFAPTVIEPLEPLIISGEKFFEPIMKMVAQSRILLRGTGIKIPYVNFEGPRRLSPLEIEELILEDRMNRVNIVLSVALKDPRIILGTFSRMGIVNDYLVKENYVGIDFIASIENIVMLALYFLPVAIEPVEPLEYDLKPNEIGGVLMTISERSREIIKTKMKK